jgi:two-component system nitrate/nitrite response regulator NarL
MNILLVDDHAILTDGIESLIRSDTELNIAAKVSFGLFALAVLKSQPVDLMITDYSMPDMSGLLLVKEARKQYPMLKIIVLSMHDEANMVQEMIGAGIDAYILKKHTHQELLQAIGVVRNGGHFWSRDISALLIKGFTDIEKEPELTRRELEVLKLLSEELNSREIAERLFIRKNLLRKTNSSGVVGLIKYAYSKRLI